LGQFGNRGRSTITPIWSLWTFAFRTFAPENDFSVQKSEFRAGPAVNVSSF
jgi:hypothetical protein